MQIHTTSTLSSAHIPSRLLLLLFFSALLQVACDADTKSVGHCGDGFLDPSEQCDGTDFGGTTCGTLGHYNSVGHLACNADCTFNLTECGGFCGDGVLQLMYAEDCEGDDLNDATCRSEGYHGGTLSCGDDCRFITDLCTGMGNQRPTFTTTPGPSAQENTQYVYSAACSDPDGDDVTLSIGDSDTCYGEFTSAGGSGVYSFTPDESQGGTSCTLHLSCADAEITEHQMQVVNIQEVNQAPVIANLPASIDAAWALPTEFDVTAEDPDQPANSLFYEITASTCSFDATINAYGRIAFTCLAEDETCDLTIRAYDNGTPVMSDSEALHITCANRDPAFTTTPATVVEEHQEYVYDIACDDPDGHSVALTRGSDTCGGTFTPVSAGRATYTFTPDEARGGTTCEAVFYCTDSYGTVSQTAAFDITETNSDPLFDNLPGTAAALWGRVGQFTATAHDIDDPAQTFDFDFVSTTCGFPVAVDPDTGDVTWTCGDPSVCEAVVSATDSMGGVTTATLQIQCTNRTPVFLTTPPIRAREDDETVINVSCRDLDNDARTLALAAGHTCGGTLTELGNGFAQIRFTATSAMGGTCSFAITCADAHSSVEQTAFLPLLSPITWASVAAGDDFSCAEHAGRLFCWGVNTSGQLGNGTTTSTNFARPIQGDYTDWSYVTNGDFHSCGLRVGRAYCWGQNGNGNLGDATTTQSLVPIEVYGSHTNWETLSAGSSHTCGIRNGHLYCWGANQYGQLGTGTTTSQTIPVEVYGLYADWTWISAGALYTCGIRAARLYCWGRNNSNQLGDNTTVDRNTPTQVYGSYTNWQSVDAGSFHTCGIKGQQVFCWGQNQNGQLGDGTTVARTVPTQINSSFSDWNTITTGYYHTCAIRENTAYCWGYNNSRQIGDGTTTNRFYPVLVSGSFTNWVGIVAGKFHTCGTRTDGVYCWGSVDGQKLNKFSPWAALTGTTSTCGIVNGELFCWGVNGAGQLGTGDQLDKVYPTRIPINTDEWSSVSNYSNNTCGISEGRGYCWGNGNNGQIGDGALLRRLIPTLVSGGHTDWDQISTGNQFVCAIRAGRRYCWGLNTSSQLGIDNLTNQTTPTDYDPSWQGWSHISAGNSYACGISHTRAYCWGANSTGRLGNGTQTTPNYIPTEVQGGDIGWSLIHASATTHTCGIRANRAFCWGSNANGQLGDGTTTNSFVPVEVSGGYTDWSWIYAHESGSTCGIRAGYMYCWGSNASGILGDGSTINRLTPILVLGGFTDWQLRSGNYGMRNGTLYTIGQTLTELYY